MAEQRKKETGQITLTRAEWREALDRAGDAEERAARADQELRANDAILCAHVERSERLLVLAYRLGATQRELVQALGDNDGAHDLVEALHVQPTLEREREARLRALHLRFPPDPLLAETDDEVLVPERKPARAKKSAKKRSVRR